MIEFEGWPKTPRLNKTAVYTEKLDGTNAAVVIEEVYDYDETPGQLTVPHPEAVYRVAAQSRNRLISPADDNHGFARWVWSQADKLVDVLGPGRHFGEWYGSGISRGYGLTKGDKRFALFNTARWWTIENLNRVSEVPGLECVTVLGTQPFSVDTAKFYVEELRQFGSEHVPGFMRPEGVCVFHTASRQVYKTFLENDEVPKGRDGG